ncbi:hypothetical protein [Azospirillum sp. SYSU D00513]|uniref:phage head spike fiber domain-containing protein n=1 Tax=Azospirillum sp. SYSU D00513 TaxID=2812561 RepID=UPI001A95D6BD|nr:hypothetical protein [Azospirillum sp. SYSU D00513]
MLHSLRAGLASSPAVLDLPFLGTETLDSRLTFTRASAGTRFDVAGVLRTAAVNAPRFDYDPTTKAPRGLLIEEARTNFARGSGDLGGAFYGKGPSVTVINATAAAPDGTGTALRLQSTQQPNCYLTTGAAGGTNNLSVVAGRTYAASFYVRVVSGPVAGNAFNMPKSDGSTRTVVASFASLGVVADGLWRRVAVPWYADTTNASYAFFFFESVPAGTVYEIWGLQFEEGTFPTSYIPTTTAAVTRAADACSMPLASVPGWNESEGTAAVEFQRSAAVPAASVLATAFEVGDGSYSNRILGLATTAAAVRLDVTTGGASQAAISAGAFSPGAPHRLAGGWKASDFAASLNGATAVTDAAGTVPAVTNLYLGCQGGGGGCLNGHIRRLALYNRRLPNEQLQALTA